MGRHLLFYLRTLLQIETMTIIIPEATNMLRNAVTIWKAPLVGLSEGALVGGVRMRPYTVRFHDFNILTMSDALCPPPHAQHASASEIPLSSNAA
jgi:hypothetical protein